MNKMQTAMVDFGECEGELVPWLVEDYLPHVGAVVVMKDDDGNACYGTVVELSEQTQMAMLRPDWDTWLAANSPVELAPGEASSRFSLAFSIPMFESKGVSARTSAKISYA